MHFVLVDERLTDYQLLLDVGRPRHQDHNVTLLADLLLCTASSLDYDGITPWHAAAVLQCVVNKEQMYVFAHILS